MYCYSFHFSLPSTLYSKEKKQLVISQLHLDQTNTGKKEHDKIGDKFCKQFQAEGEKRWVPEYPPSSIFLTLDIIPLYLRGEESSKLKRQSAQNLA